MTSIVFILLFCLCRQSVQFRQNPCYNTNKATEVSLRWNLKFQKMSRPCEKQGITQEQLAEAMGVTVGAVYKWEQNLSPPDIRIILELAHFFGVSVDVLVGCEVLDGTAEAYAKRIEELRQKKDYAIVFQDVVVFNSVFRFGVLCMFL